MTKPGDTPPPTPEEEEEAPPKVAPQDARTLKMLDLWEAARAGLQARLEDDVEEGELTASFYDTAVGFLRDSGISARTIIEAKDALEDIRMREIVQSIKEITEDAGQDEAPLPTKANGKKVPAEVVPLNAPFTPRPPR